MELEQNLTKINNSKAVCTQSFQLPSQKTLQPYRLLAQQQCIHRLLNALLREKLLTLVVKGDQWGIPLHQQQGSLTVSHVTISELSRHQTRGRVFYGDHNNTLQPISDPITLLNLIKSELNPTVNPKQWPHLKEEIENHVNNAALSAWNAHQRDQKISADAKKAGCDTLYQWIDEQYPTHLQSLFFEQFASQGHPYHPCHKTKLGLSPEEVIHFSPEFSHETAVYITALHRDRVFIETMDELPFTPFFFQHFPETQAQWLLLLELEQLNPANYIPFPIHPQPIKSELKKRFSSLLLSRQLIIFDNLRIPTQSTLSFRTVMPTTHPHQPHIKLPVAVQTTSAIRTVSPASTENGPKISTLLQKILKKENYFNGYLRILFERAGLHVTGFDDQNAKYLSALFRDNSNAHLQKGELGIVIAALFEVSLVSKTPLFVELMQLTGVKNNRDVKNYFHRYTNILLSSYLDLYLLYGIALEAHQQNTVGVFRQGELVATLARDFGGLRLHLPTLMENGFHINAYPGSATVQEERIEVRNKLLHTTYQYHLGEWIWHASRHYKIPEKQLWQIVKEETEARFNALKNRIHPALWQQERTEILKSDWSLKALLRMRLNNVSHEYLYVPVKNPLV